VHQDVSVAVPKKSFSVRNLNASKHTPTAFRKLMNVDSLTYPDIHTPLALYNPSRHIHVGGMRYLDIKSITLYYAHRTNTSNNTRVVCSDKSINARGKMRGAKLFEEKPLRGLYRPYAVTSDAANDLTIGDFR
jgi:hypothetical protein